MNYQTLFGNAFQIVLLPVLSLTLLIIYQHKTEFLERSGFGKPEVGIIIVGSLFSLVADVPIIVSDDVLLNINVGGALIPLIVCGSLMYKKLMDRRKLLALVAAVTLVGVVAFAITRYEPNLGIVAEFPHFLLPSFCALAVPVVMGWFMDFPDDVQIPFAYTAAVLGNLIGADLVRVPMLIDAGILGSIGGAGAFDLVYLSGLIAAIPLASFYYYRESFSPVSDLIERSERALEKGDYEESHRLSVEAVEKELKKAYRLIFLRGKERFHRATIGPLDILKRLYIHPFVVQDYLRFREKKNPLHAQRAQKDLVAGKLLRKAIRKRINEMYSSLMSRIGAYLIDLCFLIIPFILFIAYLLMGPRIATSAESILRDPIILALFSLTISIHFLYFTLMEWYFGATLGKMLLGLEVLTDDFEEISFVESAARNSARYADMLFIFYLVSIILIVRSAERKRIGDYIAGTRVVKIK